MLHVRKPKILVSGGVSPSAMGDLLQYYVATELLKKHIPAAQIVFSTPGSNSSLLELLSSVDLIPSLVEISSLSHLVRRISDAMFVKANEEKSNLADMASTHQAPIVDIMRILRTRSPSSWGIRYLRPAIAKVALRGPFCAGAVSGHTITSSAFFGHVTNYIVSRSLVRGPMVTFPISLSKIGIAVYKKKEKLLERSLRCFDVVFVRGPHSYELASNYVDSRRITTALDSGFGMRLLCGLATSGRKDGVVRIAIVPRREYFFGYGKVRLYDLYLNALVKLIRSLIARGATEVYLVPQSLEDSTHVYRGQRMDDVAATHDLTESLGSELSEGRLKILCPKSPVEAYRIFGSMNLVITGRMHGGIMAMAAGTPALFLLPKDDMKVLDVLSFLGLDSSQLTIDIFDAGALRFENLADRVTTLLRDSKQLQRTVTESVERALPLVDLPARVLAGLL